MKTTKHITICPKFGGAPCLSYNGFSRSEAVVRYRAQTGFIGPIISNNEVYGGRNLPVFITHE